MRQVELPEGAVATAVVMEVPFKFYKPASSTKVTKQLYRTQWEVSGIQETVEFIESRLVP